MLLRQATGDWVTYCPRYDGNRRVAEPMTIDLRGLTAGEWRQWKLKHADAIAGSVHIAEERCHELLRERVRNPVRCFVQEGETSPRAVADAAEFLNVAPDELVLELYQAVTNATTLEDGQKKTSS